MFHSDGQVSTDGAPDASNPAAGSQPEADREPRGGARHRRGPQAASGKRRDIQGLRMLAVVAVFVNHISDHPKGAFTGVDVFFVISGFLITGLLVRDAQRSGVGKFFGGFYERRARRILPAAITVLLASLVAAYATFDGTRASQSRDDIGWAAGFLANVHLAHIGTDYFAQDRPPSIVQHFWSLAVEEQFYIVWPVVVLLVLGIAGRKRAGAVTALLAVITVATVASFVYAVHDSSASPATAYFSTFARAWELGVGAIVAIVMVKFPRLPERFGVARGPIALLGVAVIVVNFFLIDANDGFPAPSGAYLVLATALVILVSGGESRWAWPLTNRVSQFLGEISYSLYLWHWPTIIIVSALMPTGKPVYYVTVIAAALALSVFSYEFIETPLRTRRQNSLEGNARPRKATAVFVVALAVVALGAYQFKPGPTHAPKINAGKAAAADQHAAAADTTIARPSASLLSELQTALAANTWPAHLTPSPSNLYSGRPTEFTSGDCFDPKSFTLYDHCTFGSPSASKLAMVVGDSMSPSWMPGIIKALEPKGYRVHGIGQSNCPFNNAAITVPNRPDETSACKIAKAGILAQIKHLHPDLLIISDSTFGITRLTSAATGRAAISEWTAGIAADIKSVKTPSMKVIVLSPPPYVKDLSYCYTPTSTPADCILHIGSDWKDKSTADEAGARLTGATYVNAAQWFCVNGICPTILGNLVMRWDRQHITRQLGEHLAPELSVVLPG